MRNVCHDARLRLAPFLNDGLLIQTLLIKDSTSEFSINKNKSLSIQLTHSFNESDLLNNVQFRFHVLINYSV